MMRRMALVILLTKMKAERNEENGGDGERWLGMFFRKG